MTALSPFAQSIFARTYQFTPDETWDACAYRVASAVANNSQQQQQFYELIRDRVFMPGGRYLYSAGRKKFANANCLPAGTFVHTRNGLIPIEDVSIGQEVLTAQGYCVVTKTFNNGIRDTVVVQTSHGDWRATSDHPFAVIRDSSIAWIEAAALRTGDELVVSREVIPGTRTELPRPHASPFVVPALTPEVAWMLGALHGDGNVGLTSSNRDNRGGAYIRFAAAELPVVEKFVHVLKLFGMNTKVRPHPTRQCFFAHATSMNAGHYFHEHFKRPKTVIRVPECIRQGTPEVRGAYLAGVCDTDGSVGATPTMLAATIYEDFAYDIQALCASLGVMAAVKMMRRAGPANAFPTTHNLFKVTVTETELNRLRMWICPELVKSLKTSSAKTWAPVPVRVKGVIAAEPTTVFDITVDGRHEFYARGVLVRNCYGLVAEDSREDWGELLKTSTICLAMGGGVGIEYSKIRPSGTPINAMGGVASGPIALMQMVNSIGRYVMMGGSRRSAIWAGLRWDHPDVESFVQVKDWDENYREMKSRRYDYEAPLDQTNVSVVIDNEYLDKLRSGDPGVQKLHQMICGYMLRTGEPAFRNQSLILRDDPTGSTGNPCQESVLNHEGTCNLGSIVMPRIRDLRHLEYVTRIAVQFLYNGSVKATYPTSNIAAQAERHRRIGLGFMGLHEWMLLNGGRYEWSPRLASWLSTWQQVSDDEATRYAKQHNGARSQVVRAIAPTGTISIIAQTTSGIEPIYALAYKRRYYEHGTLKFQYVIDPTAQRLIDQGVAPESIEDAFGLSHDIERRINVQAHIQEYVDQAISSTVNLPSWESMGPEDVTRFEQLMTEYLPRLKGVTTYPDGARSGQPITHVPYAEAAADLGVAFTEDGDRCVSGVCGL